MISHIVYTCMKPHHKKTVCPVLPDLDFVAHICVCLPPRLLPNECPPPPLNKRVQGVVSVAIIFSCLFLFSQLMDEQIVGNAFEGEGRPQQGFKRLVVWHALEEAGAKVAWLQPRTPKDVPPAAA